MNTTWPSAKRIGWTALLLAVIAALYLLLRWDGGGVVSAAVGILLVVGVLFGNFLAHIMRAKGRRRSIPLPWYLLRRAIDVGLIATVVVGFILTTHGTIKHSESLGTLTFAGHQTEGTDTVELPAGDTMMWYAVHCDICYHDGSNTPDRTSYPKQIHVAVSGPSAATFQLVSRRLDAVTNDEFGVREQKEVGRLHVATAGTYTVRVRINSDYYRDPQVAYYEQLRILFGTPQPPLLDRNRLNILAGLLALSVLIGLRPRRAPTAEPPPAAYVPSQSSAPTSTTSDFV